jgi:methylmalonyl-CoA mutase N-terminal domain/subunit
MAETRSGIPLEKVYRQKEMEAAGAADPEPPGQPPFTRGITPRMYLDKPWIMGQYAGFGSAEQTNARFRELLKAGQTGFSVALDLPTQLGLDSDHPHAHGEVGRVGVAIDSLADMETLFDRIPLEAVRQVRTTANSIGHLWLALNVALAEKKGQDPNAVRILIQNDVLKEYIARGTQIYPPRAGLRISADVIEYCARHLPSWTPLSMSGYHIRESGASAVQELAFTFANGIAYCEAAVERGLSVDDFAPSLFTFLTADMELLEEVAKYRAARRVWDRIMGERFHAQKPDSRALAAVLGGVQTLHTSAYDEALGVPTEDAATLALRTQQVILEESGLTRVVDPLGGSYAIEALTAEIEHRVLAEIQKIDELGGALACIESGWFKEQIADSAYRIQSAIDRGERKVIGVNTYVAEDAAATPDIFAIDESIEAGQLERLRGVKKSRDGRAVREALASLEQAARSGSSIVPPTIDAVRVYATVGEISETLRGVFGSYEPDAVI